MADASVLLVGGAGYFGSRLAEALCANQPVTVTYRSRPKARAAWLESGSVTSIPFDSARDQALPVKDAFGTVVNMAIPGAREVAADPMSAKERALKTIDASLALLETGQAGRVIHFSTFHVYGVSGAPDYNEATDPSPIHPYGALHLLVEQRIAAHRCSDQVVVLRPTNMVGAPIHADLGDQAGLIFLDLCQQAMAGRVALRNDGKSYRDILSFADAIEGIRLASQNPSMGGQVFNLAAGRALRLDGLAQAIAAQAAHPVDIAYGADVDAYRTAFEVSIDRMRAAGWAPKNNLTPEIARTLAFFDRLSHS